MKSIQYLHIESDAFCFPWLLSHPVFTWTKLWIHIMYQTIVLMYVSSCLIQCSIITTLLNSLILIDLPNCLPVCLSVHLYIPCLLHSLFSSSLWINADTLLSPSLHSVTVLDESSHYPQCDRHVFQHKPLTYRLLLLCWKSRWDDVPPTHWYSPTRILITKTQKIITYKIMFCY